LKRTVYILAAAIFLSGCNDAAEQPKQASADTTTKTASTSPIPASDTPSTSSDEVGISEEYLKEFYADYIKSYSTPFNIDTSFTIGNDTFNLTMQHRCLMDSAIIVPGSYYLKFYGFDSLLTHNFITSVRLSKNGNIILNRDITKEDFNKFMFENLNKYAVLRFPDFRLVSDSIFLSYSITIPLTDVGIGAHAKIDKDGKIAFAQ
jgi:hypothetical protein